MLICMLVDMCNVNTELEVVIKTYIYIYIMVCGLNDHGFYLTLIYYTTSCNTGQCDFS